VGILESDNVPIWIEKLLDTLAGVVMALVALIYRDLDKRIVALEKTHDLLIQISMDVKYIKKNCPRCNGKE
jgi:hypothetical protein